MDQMRPIDELRYLALAAQREGNRLLADELQPLGLTPSQAEALRVLEDWEPLALVELGALLVCEQGSPSRLVAGLIAAGYVERMPSSDDKRKITLTLTPAGRAAVMRVHAAEDALLSLMGMAINDDEIQTILPILWRVVAGRPAGNALARRLGRLSLPSRENG
ncbi:MAG TPA: winged helix DNA-binding protein [Ktedonobacterales bacterium]|jgi:DNA-binding MarR family transcriptional regulator|nr:winged helix DNA-binding protein [Ktedonobacterales bacterium]